MQANFALARETKPQNSVHPDEGMKRGDRSTSIHISFLHCSSLLINSNDTYTAVRFRLPPPSSDGLFPHPVHACTYWKQKLFCFIGQGVEGTYWRYCSCYTTPTRITFYWQRKIMSMWYWNIFRKFSKKSCTSAVPMWYRRTVRITRLLFDFFNISKYKKLSFCCVITINSYPANV